MTELDPAAVPDALRSGALDVALVHEYEFVPAPRDPALDTEPLLEEAIYLASARPAPMMDEDAAGEEAASEEAASEDPVGRHRDSPWIMASPGTLCHTMAVRACQAAGFTPRIRHHADDFVTVLALVAAEQGVALVPQLGAIGPPPGVVLTELPARRRTRIAYRNGTRHHPPVSACIAAIHAAADTHRVGRRP